jgi:CRP/FNR family cyclic AMP-dependent transcriptional regulator
MPIVALKAPSVPVEPEDLLQTLFAHAEVKDFPKHSPIINEGEKTNLVYLIRSGRVKVFLRGQDGKKVDINVLQEGDFFGEMALDEGLRSASVMTMAPSRLSVIPQSAFRAFLVENPDFAMRVILKLILRTRGLLQSVRSLALLDVYGRVARTLLELATLENDDLVINDKPSAQDIAYLIGTSRESVSRTLKDLADGGYIQVDGKKMTITKDLPSHL